MKGFFILLLVSLYYFGYAQNVKNKKVAFYLDESRASVISCGTGDASHSEKIFYHYYFLTQIQVDSIRATKVYLPIYKYNNVYILEPNDTTINVDNSKACKDFIAGLRTLKNNRIGTKKMRKNKL